MATTQEQVNAGTFGTVQSRGAWRTGWILSGIVIVLLAFDSLTKIFPNRQTIEGTLHLGYQLHHIQIIGAIALVCLILYIIPRTAPIGAVLFTGYLGGAVASNLRLDFPLFTYILAPIYVAVFLWGGLYLRDERVRALLRAAR